MRPAACRRPAPGLEAVPAAQRRGRGRSMLASPWPARRRRAAGARPRPSSATSSSEAAAVPSRCAAGMRTRRCGGSRCSPPRAARACSCTCARAGSVRSSGGSPALPARCAGRQPPGARRTRRASPRTRPPRAPGAAVMPRTASRISSSACRAIAAMRSLSAWPRAPALAWAMRQQPGAQVVVQVRGDAAALALGRLGRAQLRDLPPVVLDLARLLRHPALEFDVGLLGGAQRARELAHEVQADHGGHHRHDEVSDLQALGNGTQRVLLRDLQARPWPRWPPIGDHAQHAGSPRAAIAARRPRRRSLRTARNSSASRL